MLPLYMEDGRHKKLGQYRHYSSIKLAILGYLNQYENVGLASYDDLNNDNLVRFLLSVQEQHEFSILYQVLVTILEGLVFL